MKLSRLWLAFSFFATTASAQNFGGNPPGKWAQVNTEAVRVIFPVGMDSIAQRVATLTRHLQRDSTYNLRLRKINLVLQTNTTVSNAYVSLAPYRSEFYLMAPQNAFELGGINWADNLVVHEWRHVQQYNYFNRGLARVASVFLGQEGRALLNAAAVPDWFFEGDAVWNETRVTPQGRGRMPLAFSGYKSLYFDGKDYSYMKLRNGSLKHFVPDHYDLGYLLVAYGAEKYGNDFWSKVTADASGFRPLFYPLQGAVKKYSGIPFRQFVKDAFSFYQDQWSREKKGAEINWLSKENNYRTDYLFPYADEQGGIIALRQSSKSNPAFVHIAPDGTEKRIAAQDITLDRYFSYRNGKIVYAGYYPDARWSNREYNNIVVLDVADGSKRKISSQQRYFSPDISADGTKIIAVEMQTTGASNLVMLDANGQRLRTISGQAGEVFSQPKFSDDANTVFVAVRDGKGRMSLRAYFVPKEVMQKTLVPFGNYIIGFPVVKGDTITVTASSGTRDDVYAWLQQSGKLYHVASYPAGLYQSAFSGGKLVASAVTASGYRLAVLQPRWKEVRSPEPLQDLYVNKALDSAVNINNIPTERFSYTKYGKFAHPFNFHSWRPYYDPPEYSFTVYGQNVLNTIASELAYTYNENENSHAASANLVYGGTYIQPFAGVNHTWNRRLVFTPDTVATWNELEWLAGLQLPLELTGGKMFRYLNLAASYHSTNINFTGANKNLFRGTDVNYLQGRIAFSSQIQRAAQHIYPHLAFTMQLQGRNALNLDAQQFLASGSVFLPGLFKTHSLVFSAAWQGRDTMRQYSFTNNFPFSRGYHGGRDFPRMWKVAGNYHFPLFHPDWGFGNIVFFQRVRANAFLDFTRVKSLRTGLLTDFASAGGELFFDTRWWNQLPVSFGIRYSRLENGATLGLAANQWELILPVDLIR